MDEVLIQNWNNTVNYGDYVYILGDFSFRDNESTKRIIDRLNGFKYLIQGNHDPKRIIKLFEGFDLGLSHADTTVIESFTDTTAYQWYASHYPVIDGIFTQPRCDKISSGYDSNYTKYYGDMFRFLLNGHVHTNWKYSLNKKGTLMINVGVDVNNYAPISLIDVISSYEKHLKGKLCLKLNPEPNSHNINL